MRAIVLTDPLCTAPDLTTAGALLRFSGLRDVGFGIDQARDLADAGYAVIGIAVTSDALNLSEVTL